MDSQAYSDYAPLVVSLLIGAALCLLILRPLLRSKKSVEQQEEQDSDAKSRENAGKQSQSQRQQAETAKTTKQKAKEKPSKVTFTHAWLAGSLKGHTDIVNSMDSSANGKYIVTSSDDRSCRLWNVRELEEREHKNLRCNVQLDTPSCVRFSPDSRAFGVALRNANTIRVYRITQAGGFEEAIEFPRTYKSADLITFSIASTGKYVLLAYADTRLQLVTLRGELLASFDSLLVRNSFATASPCARFVAACGFSREVRVWEVKYTVNKGGDSDNTSGSFTGVGDAFTLSGHKAGVCHVEWSADSCRIATLSRDSTWRVYDVASANENYARGASPTLLASGTHSFAGDDQNVRAAFSPDGYTLAIGSGSRIELHDADANAERSVTIEFGADSIDALAFSHSSKYILVAVGKTVYTLHNVFGARVHVASLERRRAATSNANVRERLVDEVEKAQQNLAALEKKVANSKTSAEA